jgi:hypothetical protein
LFHRFSDKLGVLRNQAAVPPQVGCFHVFPVAGKCSSRDRCVPHAHVQAGYAITDPAGAVRGNFVFSANQAEDLNSCSDVAQDKVGDEAQVNIRFLQDYVQAENSGRHDWHFIQEIRSFQLEFLLILKTETPVSGRRHPATIEFKFPRLLGHRFSPAFLSATKGDLSMKSTLLSIVGNYFKNDRLCSLDADKAGERRYSPGLE